MTTSPKYFAKKVAKKYKISKLSENNIRRIITDQGYTIVEFHRICNDSDVDDLINALHIEDYIQSSKGFTFANENYRIVFVNSELTSEEKLLVLSHEEGHIALGHATKHSIIGEDVIQEYEANEFVHYLMTPGALTALWRKHKKLLVIMSFALFLICSGLFVSHIVTKQNSYYGVYYVTETGSKYHKKDCIFIKGKRNVRRLTKEEYESGKYGPCGTCLPDEE